MFQSTIKEITPLLLSVQYTYTRNKEYDYSQKPRPCHNLVFMLEGEAIIEANDEIIHLTPKNILFIPQNTTYKALWVAKPNAIFHSLHFCFTQKCNPFLNKCIPVQLLQNNHFDELYQHLISIKNFQFEKNANAFIALSSFYAICGKLFRSLKFNSPRLINNIITPALTYIEQNYNKAFTVQQLANLCCLSSSRFYYLFKEQTGTSPIVYKNNLAIQNISQELLFNKDISIKELAAKHGFPNAIYFERLFKKITGKTPSQYRKENRLL